MSKETEVTILRENVVQYPTAPFSPPEHYPELKALPYDAGRDQTNGIYGMVRTLLFMHGFDHDNYGRRSWNPLSEVVSEGDTVVILPNLVSGEHPLGKLGQSCTITHPSIVRPIVDYIVLALRGKGKVIICNAPIGGTDFDKMCKETGFASLVDFYSSRLNSITLQLLDLRSRLTVHRGFLPKELEREGDPLGHSVVDLGSQSFHSEISRHWKKYVVTGYDLNDMRREQTDMHHRYHISNTVLNADVIISIPKLKTHRKAGISVCLKSWIGACTSKKNLPHHRSGAPESGGDEYPRTVTSVLVKRILLSAFRNTPAEAISASIASRLFAKRYGKVDKRQRNPIVQEGNWVGNDTLWRTVLDLNIIMKYATRSGLGTRPASRRFLFIVDGVMGAERNAPLSGSPRHCGIMLLGTNACAVDYSAAKLMGFDERKLKQIAVAFEKRRQGTRYPLVDFDKNDVKVHSNFPEYVKIDRLTRERSLKFLAPDGWEALYGGAIT